MARLLAAAGSFSPIITGIVIFYVMFMGNNQWVLIWARKDYLNLT